MSIFTINDHEPIFFVGAPKAGSTSIHIALSNTGLLNFTDIKDSHYLLENTFSIEQYSKFFHKNHKRIFEVDQNLAIHTQPFINISEHFHSFYLVYVVRDPKERFLSSYKWLRKMGMVKTIKEAVNKYHNWMIEHGRYRKNITENIQPHMKGKGALLVVRFEELVKSDGITFSRLLEKLNISADTEISLVNHNESTAARSEIVVNCMRQLFVVVKRVAPKRFINFVKTSAITEKLLFKREKIFISEDDVLFINTYSGLFSEEELYLNSLNFYDGIAEVDAV